MSNIIRAKGREPRTNSRVPNSGTSAYWVRMNSRGICKNCRTTRSKEGITMIG